MASLQARAKEFVSEEHPKDSAVNASPELQQLANSTALGDGRMCLCFSRVRWMHKCLHALPRDCWSEIGWKNDPRCRHGQLVAYRHIPLAARSHDGMLRAIAISIVLSVMKLAGQDPCFSSIKTLYTIDTLRKAFMYLTYMCASEE